MVKSSKTSLVILAKAKSIIKDNPAVMFDFADINYSIVFKLNDEKFHYFIAKINLIRFYKNIGLC